MESLFALISIAIECRYHQLLPGQSRPREMTAVVGDGDRPRRINKETAVAEAAGRAVDSTVVGTNVRAGSQRVYLDPRVERIVREAPCSTLILNI